jgi:hypothetical protein
LNVPPPQEDHTAQLIAAAARLPAPLHYPEPSSVSRGEAVWVREKDYAELVKGTLSRSVQRPDPAQRPMTAPPLDFSVALGGPWEPQSRWTLPVVIKTFEDLGDAPLFEEIHRLSGKPACWMNSRTGDPAGAANARGLIRYLMANARYQMASRNDVAKAARRLETALRFTDNLYDDGTVICSVIAVACRAFITDEVGMWTEELDLTHEQSRELIDVLARNMIPALEGWKRGVEGELRLGSPYVDALYCRQPDGDGWAVLYSEDPDEKGDGILCAGNLLSVFLPRRRSFEHWYDRITERVDRIEEFTPQLLRELEPLERPYIGIHHAPWPNMLLCRPLSFAMHADATHKMAMTALALEAHRKANGAYPASLDRLHEIHPALPIPDPISKNDFRYVLTGADGFRLWSVGADGEDDGGKADEFKGAPIQEDWVFDPIRGFGSEEWYLVTKEDLRRFGIDDVDRLYP